ncbi:hypothetical protein GIB67_035657 [Kingdonia uniflora]|uniref:Uncharacterized protein n=1 Tax=Kingdonia uniflora TaxID=39325 RepID=A0A7J7KUR0_9MAGN|nr:hypothetical protein GIB67_035657 [Kingdonia uniflora]
MCIMSGVHHALNPDPYRGCFGSDRLKYAKDVKSLIDYGTSDRVANFIAEAIQGVGGHAVLKVIKKEQLQQNAFVIGSYLKECLMYRKEKYKIIRDVRGRGLILRLELVTDHQLKTPAKVDTLGIMDSMNEMGVLVGKCGFHGIVFRVTPPLCLSKEDADYFADVVDHAMSKI